MVNVKSVGGGSRRKLRTRRDGIAGEPDVSLMATFGPSGVRGHSVITAEIRMTQVAR